MKLSCILKLGKAKYSQKVILTKTTIFQKAWLTFDERLTFTTGVIDMWADTYFQGGRQRSERSQTYLDGEDVKL